MTSTKPVIASFAFYTPEVLSHLYCTCMSFYGNRCALWNLSTPLIVSWCSKFCVEFGPCHIIIVTLRFSILFLGVFCYVEFSSYFNSAKSSCNNLVRSVFRTPPFYSCVNNFVWLVLPRTISFIWPVCVNEMFIPYILWKQAKVGFT